MHQSLAHAYQAYQKTEVTTLTQAEIIARLYEALENSLQQAKKAIFDGNVAKKGENIRHLTKVLKEKFKMDNPQIEVAEIEKPELDAQTMAELIVTTFERYGPKRFKSIGYKALQRIMDAGARGAEIIISGRGVPSSRAKSWRFYAGYLKKCGEEAVTQIKKGFCVANLKSGSIGVKVRIMTPDVELPDTIKIKKEIKVEPSEEEKEEKKNA